MSLDLEKQPPSLTGSSPSSSSSADPVKPRRTTKQALPVQTDIKIMVVWLESLEDYTQFPIGSSILIIITPSSPSNVSQFVFTISVLSAGDLLPSTYTGLEHSRVIQPSDVQVIFLQALGNGLMRVRLQGPVSRINLATPLIDGMVVSRRVLGTLVRQTALNMGRRKRLDNDRYVGLQSLHILITLMPVILAIFYSYHPPHVRRRLKIQEMVQKYRKNLTDPELLTLLFSNTQTYQV